VLLLLAGLLLSPPLQSTAAVAQASTPEERVPDNQFWPSLPNDQRPFLVVGYASARGGNTLAFTNSPIGRDYVVMRRKGDGVEQIDSRDCSFTEELESVRNLEMPEIVVPGSMPLQDWPYPEFGHATWTLHSRLAVQSDKHWSYVTLGASQGPIAEVSAMLFQTAWKCFPSEDQP